MRPVIHEKELHVGLEGFGDLVMRHEGGVVTVVFPAQVDKGLGIELGRRIGTLRVPRDEAMPGHAIYSADVGTRRRVEPVRIRRTGAGDAGERAVRQQFTGSKVASAAIDRIRVTVAQVGGDIALSLGENALFSN